MSHGLLCLPRRLVDHLLNAHMASLRWQVADRERVAIVRRGTVHAALFARCAGLIAAVGVLRAAGVVNLAHLKDGVSADPLNDYC